MKPCTLVQPSRLDLFSLRQIQCAQVDYSSFQHRVAGLRKPGTHRGSASATRRGEVAPLASAERSPNLGGESHPAGWDAWRRPSRKRHLMAIPTAHEQYITEASSKLSQRLPMQNSGRSWPCGFVADS